MRKALMLLLLLLLPLRADALTLPYAPETVLSVLEMTDAQRALAEFLYTPVFNMETRIDLPKGTPYKDASAAMVSLMQDYPELFHLGKDYVIGYYRDAPETAVWLEPAYRMSADEAAQARAVLYAQAYLIADACPDALEMHDQLCALVTYGGDTEMRHTAVGALLEGQATCEGYAQAYLIADACPDALEMHDQLCALVTYGGDTELRHTAVGALLEGQATCEGYAQALTLLFRMKGIPCGVITGTAVDNAGVSERHSWCIADVDGFTLIDPTWNDQDALGLNTHWYYGLSTGQMAADHTPDAGQDVPLCDAHANWHDRHGYYVSGLESADAAIRRLVAGETINLRTDDLTMYTALTDDLSTWLEHYNERNPDAAFYGAYSLTKCDAQTCIILQRVD